MKTINSNSVRARYISSIVEMLKANGEDVDYVASNTCNLPIVEDGEEGMLEIVVKVVKKDYDECMQERVDYVNHIVEMEEKAKAKAEEKAKKIAEKEKKKPKAEETK